MTKFATLEVVADEATTSPEEPQHGCCYLCAGHKTKPGDIMIALCGVPIVIKGEKSPLSQVKDVCPLCAQRLLSHTKEVHGG